MRNICFIFFVITACSCNYIGNKRITGNGKLASEQRSASGFTSIKLAGPYDVQLQQGAEFSVRVEGDENILRHFETRIDGHTLKIGAKKNYNLRSKNGIKVYIIAPTIEELHTAGSGRIRSSSKIMHSSKIDIEIGGSGQVALDVDAPKIEATIAGSGSVTLRGATRDFRSKVAGSGEIHAFDLLSENSKVSIAGSGDAELFASKNLEISIAGSGNVLYKGSPVVKKKIAGSGDIQQVH